MCAYTWQAVNHDEEECRMVLTFGTNYRNVYSGIGGSNPLIKLQEVIFDAHWYWQLRATGRDYQLDIWYYRNSFPQDT